MFYDFLNTTSYATFIEHSSDSFHQQRPQTTHSFTDSLTDSLLLPKYLFPWTDPQTPYLSRPWTRPTYDAKRHPDPPFFHNALDGPTDRRTYIDGWNLR